ncbi:hypothetical protein CAEBREN_03044 [Caenorhabditis brenneri]|uniref:Uncharacterized protein n=1 Tax=Caenorhabditis brenneri TaxID=135651 RepID=G0ML07_CAEBE|nr:hypothetical protein CAEBREN_03044 [Caenorhabditis brenneri]
MKNLRIGLIGLIVFNFCLLISVIAKTQMEKSETPLLGYLISISSSIVFFQVFTSCYPVKYIRIPELNRPFSKKNRYVIVLLVIHALMMSVVMWFTTYILECFLLILCSFCFSIDLYSTTTTGDFTLVDNPMHTEETTVYYTLKHEKEVEKKKRSFERNTVPQKLSEVHEV